MSSTNSELNSHSHSVSQYIEGLRAGDGDSTQKIWERFYGRLVRLASQKLSTNKKAADEDDVVQEAFAQFFREVEQGRFPKLDDRHDLWQVLAMLVDRRAKDHAHREQAQKRGGGNVHTESIFMKWENSGGIAGVPNPEPTVDLARELSEVFGERMKELDDQAFRELALLKLQGYNNREIAEKTGFSLRTVERRLEQIRAKWRTEQDQ